MSKLLRSKTITLSMKVHHQGQSKRSPHTKALESGPLEDWEKFLGVGYGQDTLTPERLSSCG